MEGVWLGFRLVLGLGLGARLKGRVRGITLG